MSQNYPFFQQEMRYLRQSVEAFSHTYPEVAAELKLSAGRSNDPHVEQLLQSFAFMTGRLRADLEQQKDQIPNQLLHSLYPNLMRSLPCMTVLQAKVEADGANFINGYQFDKGRQFIGSAARTGKNGQQEKVECCFENCYPTELWPLEVVNTQVLSKSLFVGLDELNIVSGQILQSVISVKVANTGTESIRDYPIEKLRFYIADVEQRAKLYKLLNDDLIGIAVRVGEKITRLDSATKPLAQMLQWQGFDDDQNVLPDDAGSQRAYRLLQEYFAFVEKFYFLDIVDLHNSGALNQAQEGFEILFLLEQSAKNIHLHKHCFRLNCFPAINLYEKTFKPVPLQHNQHEYRLLADESHYLQGEVHSISQVKSISFSGHSQVLSSWLGPNGKGNVNQYYVTRLTGLLTPGERGCDTFLSIYNPDFSPSQPVDQTIMVKGLCNNRRLPEALREGQALQLVGSGPMLSASILGMPTKFKGASLEGKNNIKLLSQLSLNLDALGTGSERLAILKQILRLYCDPLSSTHSRQLEGLVSMSSRAVTKRIGGDMWRGHCRGNQISLEINEDYFSDANPLLLGSVLSYFFGLYTTLNHFVQLQLISDQREGVWQQWQPRIGEKVIL
ncbi:type VI secretion system baseplate subunit TssF [Marinomonas transparens]|uniref:Type VI secretion system baseplate subunit TssF n=1 Tax=Marinomonas transparens TaxID=2795388 RepID=A0A934N3T1_9GAMM|nr:type VI secretion system baseplate subunit TssF [Marinomonas transparens]MBJ7540007.1 type VI secretion system baseplate subunit TssF [Marinomonas transparens]